MRMEFRSLSYALGAEVVGVNVGKPLDNVTFDALHAALLEHCVLLFRDQPLNREQHLAFSRRFGELDRNEAKRSERPDAYPEITMVVSRPGPHGEPATGRYTGAEWHTDHSNYPVAAGPSLLRAVEVPEIGGDTMFANMYMAYESLSEGMKQVIDGLYGVHIQGRALVDPIRSQDSAEWKRRYPAAAHPVVRVHPETGRKALYVNEQVRLFVGMTAAESWPLIEFLTAHAVRPQNVYRHRWRKDDLLVWDNRCLLHIALADYDRTKVRHMERTTVNGLPSGYVYEGPLE